MRVPPSRAPARAPSLARALAPALALVLAGCAQPAADDWLVPYPRAGDVAVYEVSSAYIELARWENGHPFNVGKGRVQFEVATSERVLDGARQVHPAYRVTTSTTEGGGFVKHADLYVSTEHHDIVQSVYPLSQDQSVVAFDERGFPWLFGASALFGATLFDELLVPLQLRDELGTGRPLAPVAWRVAGPDGGEKRLVLEGASGVTGEVWVERGSAWPTRARLEFRDDGLAPNLRVDGALPVAMEARRVEVRAGSEPLPPRNSGAAFVDDADAKRAAWDGEKPPDGDAGYVPYLLADAVRDTKLLDRELVEWLAAADDPRVYRATHKDVPIGLNETGPLPQTGGPYWSIQWMEKGGAYYQVEVQRIDVAPLGTGAPRILSSAPADAPQDESHGWFAKDALLPDLVTLSEGARIVRQVFGAKGLEVFLRSFTDPPGYSYYIDGGFEAGEAGRYTVVYDPQRGFIAGATGPVSARFAQAAS